MTQEQLENNLKEGKLDYLYLFYGEETYLLETNVKKIKKLFGETVLGINYINIDETNIQNAISDISSPAFGFEKKLIIIKNADLFKKEAKKKSAKLQNISIKILEYLQENIQQVKEGNVLVFIEKEAEKNDLYTFIEENGIVCNFENLKPQELVKKLKSICNAYKVNVDISTLMYLIENCGTNMQDLINEIRKLIEYVGENGIIKKENIDKLSIKQTEAIVFDLTDYLGTKETRKSNINFKRLNI